MSHYGGFQAIYVSGGRTHAFHPHVYSGCYHNSVWIPTSIKMIINSYRLRKHVLFPSS